MAKQQKTKQEKLPAAVAAALSDFAHDSYVEQIAIELAHVVGRLRLRPSEPWVRNFPLVDYLTTKLMRERGLEGDELLGDLQWQLLEVIDKWQKEHLKEPSPALSEKIEEAFALVGAAVQEEKG